MGIAEVKKRGLGGNVKGWGTSEEVKKHLVERRISNNESVGQDYTPGAKKESGKNLTKTQGWFEGLKKGSILCKKKIEQPTRKVVRAIKDKGRHTMRKS